MDVEGHSSTGDQVIMMQSDMPCPTTPIPYMASQGYMLPQISLHRSVISGGQPVEIPYSCTQPPAWSDDNHFKHPSEIFRLKTKPGVFGQQPVCTSAKKKQPVCTSVNYRVSRKPDHIIIFMCTAFWFTFCKINANSCN